MNLAMGVLCLWLGAAFIWLAARGTAATSPWGAYQEVIKAIGSGVDE